jgi:hypothetical protein
MHGPRMRLPDALLRLASDQLGLLARHQVVPVLGPVAADHALASSRFHRVQRGVYQVRGGAPHPCQLAVASTLRAGPGSVLTGPAALLLLNLDGVCLGPVGAVAVPAGRRLRELGAPVLPERDPSRPTWSLGQVQVAQPADALLEACLLPTPPDPRALRLTHDRLRWTGRLRAGVLHSRAVELGVDLDDQRLDELLELDGSREVGDGERRLGRLLSRFDPPPEAQVWVTPHRCVDWYFRQLRVGIEYQGSVDHDSPSGRRRDRTRDEELSLIGTVLVYASAADLDDERSLLARVAAALTVRADELGQRAPTLRAR